MASFEFNEHTICKYTNEQLKEMAAIVQEELETRKRKKKEELISKFEKAFYDLRENYISVYILDDEINFCDFSFD